MEEIDLKKIFELFWRKKLQVVIIIAVCGVLGLIYTLGFVKPVYQSWTKIVLATSSSNSGSSEQGSVTTTDLTLNSKLVSTYNELIKSNTVVRQVISNLGIPELEENSVRKNISVESVEDTEVIKITVTNENPIYAAKIANEIVKVFTEQIVGEYYNIDNVHVVDEAEVAAGPSNINHAKDVAIFLFIGIILAGAYIFILYMLDTTVKEAEDIEKIVELPVLASIPVYDLGNDKGGKR